MKFENLENKELLSLGMSSLTQNEINSFKWGNSPSKETLIKSELIKTWEAFEAKITNSTALTGKYLQTKIVSEYLKFVNSFETLEELQKTSILGFGSYK